MLWREVTCLLNRARTRIQCGYLYSCMYQPTSTTTGNEGVKRPSVASHPQHHCSYIRAAQPFWTAGQLSALSKFFLLFVCAKGLNWPQIQIVKTYQNFNQFSNFPLFWKENLIQFYLKISENFKGGGSWRGGAIVNKSRQSNSETLDAYISKTVLHKTILFSVKICNRGRAARWHIG